MALREDVTGLLPRLVNGSNEELVKKFASTALAAIESDIHLSS